MREVRPLRGFLRLPEPLTRYDPDNRTISVGGHGPMASGDDVAVVGTLGWQGNKGNLNDETGLHHFEGDCPADVPFWAATMRPTAAGEAESPDSIAQAGALAGLFAWDYELGSPAPADAEGVLVIEAPCLYIEQEPRDTSLENGPHRYLLRSPRPLVRFDPDSDSLWVGHHGPMTTGDKVHVSGADFPTLHNGSGIFEMGCSARGHFTSFGLSPADLG